MLDLTQKIEEHKKMIERKTMSIREWAEIEGITYQKALQLSHAKDFPCISIGKSRRIVISKLDAWLEKYIGTQF
ncbi:DNA-binding protein [Clostridium sp. OS1-26]|uniref:DNA-binding protein n=1 Tax=Clostridium sp. OS1-26 TaxID=3070681 RepID=UPI0027DF940E|nr:DNA-binding protein [Clostridium sp. OS1-26]WML35669.1 DNA-binding protein [Clostridium sp. OS1-26]